MDEAKGTPAADTHSDPDEAQEPKALSLGAAIGRSMLRGAVLGVAMAVVLPSTLVVLWIITAAAGERGPPNILGGMGIAALCGLCLGVPLMPLALVEALAARRGGRRSHAFAAVLTLPVGLAALALLAVQVTYAVAMFERGDFAEAGRAALKVAAKIPETRARDLFMICALLAPVPLTTYFRLRGYTRPQQLARVIPGTVLLAAAFCVASLSTRIYGSPSLLGAVAVPTAFAAIIGALLPGAYVRGDQLEGWALRKLREWRE